MEKSIYNIGKLGYLLTILFGKNKEIKKVTKEIVDKNKGAKQIDIPGNLIITIGKKNVIITNNQNGRREPIIVKPWVKGQTIYENNKKVIPYMDNESYNWFYTFDNIGELVTFFKESDENSQTVFYHLELK